MLIKLILNSIFGYVSISIEGFFNERFINICNNSFFSQELNSSCDCFQNKSIFLGKCNIPCSKSVCYVEENSKCYYLRTCINGYSLIDKKIKDNPDLLIDILVNVINCYVFIINVIY